MAKNNKQKTYRRRIEKIIEKSKNWAPFISVRPLHLPIGYDFARLHFFYDQIINGKNKRTNNERVQNIIKFNEKKKKAWEKNHTKKQKRTRKKRKKNAKKVDVKKKEIKSNHTGNGPPNIASNHADNDYPNVASNHVVNDLSSISNSQLENFFEQLSLDDLAKVKKFILRVSKITALRFVIGFLIALLQPICITMALFAETINHVYGINVTRQALCSKLTKRACRFFLRAVLKKAIEKLKSVNVVSDPVFSKFSCVLLGDCTTVKVKKWFKKNNEGKSLSNKATKKIFMLFDISTYLVNFIDLFKGNETDTTIGKRCLNNLKKKTLVILDLGFFCMEILKKLKSRESYFIMRLKSTSNVYLNKEDTTPINLVDYIKSNIKANGFLDQIVYITKQKVEVRLVANVAKEEVINKRIQSHKKEESETPSDELIKWFSISAYITNIPEEMCSAEEIVRLYEMRWQVELVFKNCKSNLQLDTCDVSNENTIDSLIYLRLLLFVVETFFFNTASKACKPDDEISMHKVTVWLHSFNRLVDALINDNFTSLAHELKEDIRKLLKEKRRRRTSLEKYKQAASKRRITA